MPMSLPPTSRTTLPPTIQTRNQNTPLRPLQQRRTIITTHTHRIQVLRRRRVRNNPPLRDILLVLLAGAFRMRILGTRETGLGLAGRTDKVRWFGGWGSGGAGRGIGSGGYGACRSGGVDEVGGCAERICAPTKVGILFCCLAEKTFVVAKIRGCTSTRGRGKCTRRITCHCRFVV